MPVYKFGGNPEVEEEETHILERVDKDYVRLNGDNTFTGPLDMGENRIVRVGDPIQDDDAVTKKYVDEVKSYSETLVVGIHDAYSRDFRERAVKKIVNPRQKLVVSTENGNIADSDIAVGDVALKNDITPKLTSASGNKVLMSDSDGNIVESEPIAYTSINPRSNVISGYIRKLGSGENLDAISLKAGIYRITVDCFFDGLSGVKQMYLGIREKDAVAPYTRGNVMRWRAAVSQVTGGAYIAQSSIVNILRDMTNAIFIPTLDTTWTTPNTTWTCDFVIERIA